MIIGFTGTRFGLTPAQGAALADVVLRPACYYAERHLNGGCRGADREMFAYLLGLDGVIEVLPGSVEQAAWAEEQRASLLGRRYIIHEVEPYLARDLKIALRCNRLIACPGTATEQLRSGTWATVRYARKAGKPITLVLPDGQVVEETPTEPALLWP
jgi:predicted Rossmann fold nucleotide-binding protein DprA/Smf involved in DNA uptake